METGGHPRPFPAAFLSSAAASRSIAVRAKRLQVPALSLISCVRPLPVPSPPRAAASLPQSEGCGRSDHQGQFPPRLFLPPTTSKATRHAPCAVEAGTRSRWGLEPRWPPQG